MAQLLSFLYTQLFVSLPYPTTSFAEKTVIITGSNTGLGKEAARHVAHLKASLLILAVRDVNKGEAARQDILATTSADPSTIEVWELDLSSYQSVIAFAARAAKLSRLDVLLENAGVITGKFKLIEQDETTITVNVVSTFLLALLLIPKLKETASRYGVRPNLTVVTSEVHSWSPFAERNEPAIFTALSDPEKADMSGERYQISKLLEVLIVREWASQQSALDYPLTINMVNPGLCHSDLARESGMGLYILKLLLARTTEVGSRTLVHSALAGAETHGMYLSDCKVTMPSAFVRSDEGKEVQRKLWDELKGKLEKIQPGVTENL